MTAPLAGIRVVDLTMVWAGPFGTRLLGDYGAEVIKVESPRAWDLLRSLGMIPRDVPRWYNQSAYFNHNNRGKYGVALDLSSERGREILLQLCAVSDVIVENFRTDVMDKLGLDYEAVRAANPRIIYISMPGHGKTGPERDYVAYGSNVEQLAGLVSLSGYEGGEPLKTGFSYGDPMAGTALVAAVAMAVRQRNRTGEGCQIDLAQRENLGMFVGEYLVDYSMNREPRPPIGNRHAHFAPHNVYRCAGEDRWVAIACETDEHFAALCDVIGRPDLVADPRYATPNSGNAAHGPPRRTPMLVPGRSRRLRGASRAPRPTRDSPHPASPSTTTTSSGRSWACHRSRSRSWPRVGSRPSSQTSHCMPERT
jgi:benzylsuccinate CoA-transferase BbsF subunit